MAILRSIQSVLLLVVYASINGQVSRAQQGFLNIACGADTGFVDSQTTLQWQADTAFITTGATGLTSIADSNSELKRFRYFNDPVPNKFCYTLPVTPATNYTLRASFLAGNINLLGPVAPSFQLSVDATVVANVTTVLNAEVYREVTYRSRLGNTTFLCLLPGPDVPFISAISLRPAVMDKRFDLYLSDMKIIRTRARWNFGGQTGLEPFLRFPTDYNDRYWSAIGPKSASLSNSTAPVTVLSTTHSINLTTYKNLVPEVVLQTAVTVQNGNLSISIPVYSPVSHLILHFAELDNTTTSVSREYMVKVPSVTQDSYVNPFNFTHQHYKPYYWYFWNVQLTSLSDLTFYPINNSRLGPLVNAMELFTILDVAASTTLDQDAQTIEALKMIWNLSEWTGDPCLPVQYSWLSCSTPSLSTLQPSVEQVSLSAYNLQGTIPASTIALLDITSLSLDNNALTGPFPNLSSMTNLATLHLHNNQLSGPLPDFLTTMGSLTELSIQNNNFSGTIPPQLLATGFNFTYRPGNPFLMESNSSVNATVSSIGTKSVGHSPYVFVTAAILTSLYM